MPTIETTANTSQTLAQLMAKGRIPVSEALRYSMMLADALRRVHDSGQAHGAVSPSCVALNRAGLELLPANDAESITPYTAPEVVQSKLADSRSDIFSFGAVLYEMLTGRAPFQGDSPEALAAAIMNSAPPPSGSPAVDRLVAGCMAKDPAARFPKMQKLVLELKLLLVAVRRSESAPRPQPDPLLRAEMQQIEARLSGRLSSCEQSLAAIHERLDRMEQLLNATVERAGRIEQEVATCRQDGASLRETISEDLANLDRALHAQAASIESVRTAMAQTDDLVERVVEALDSLQSVVLDHSEDRNLALS